MNGIKKQTGRVNVYRLYDEDGCFMRVTKRKEEAEHFVKFYGWTAKFFRDPKKQKQKDLLKHMEESPI
jgi:hypothetical protein